MKRLWACAVIFVILIAACVYGNIQTNKITGDLIATVQGAEQAAKRGDNDLAYQLSKKAKDDWHTSHRILCIYMPHGKLEAIDQTLGALPSLIHYSAMDNFTADCERSILQIQYLNESEIPLLENIF